MYIESQTAKFILQLNRKLISRLLESDLKAQHNFTKLRESQMKRANIIYIIHQMKLNLHFLPFRQNWKYNLKGLWLCVAVIYKKKLNWSSLHVPKDLVIIIKKIKTAENEQHFVMGCFNDNRRSITRSNIFTKCLSFYINKYWKVYN